MRRLLRAAASACLALTALAAPALLGAVPVSADAGGPVVGFWAGQNLGGFCGPYDPTTCPRPTTSYTPDVWQALVDGHGKLYLNLIYGSDFGPPLPGAYQRTDAVPLIAKANTLGVPIDAWLTVPLSKGVFANEENADTMQAAVKAFAGWSVAQGVHVDQIDLDLEFPLGYQALADALTTGDTSTLVNAMHANIDPSHQCAAARTYRDTISWAHQHGLRIAGSPILFAADDLANGSTALQDALDQTAFPPFGYDNLYLQAYRAFAPGLDLGSGVVASYFTDMQHYFGSIGQVSLGNTGTAPYDKVGPLVDDIRMLAAMGAKEIPIFDLDHAVSSYGAAGILQVLTAGQHPMSPAELSAAEQMSPRGIAARSLFATLDATATALTPVVTTAYGHPQLPNAYPNGCGNLTAAPFQG